MCASRIWDELVQDAHYDESHRDAVIGVAEGHGGLSVAPSLRVVTHGLLILNATRSRALSAYLVPDGVASIDVHYVRITGPLRHRTASPARVIHVVVTHNLAVWRSPTPSGLFGGLAPREFQWRAAYGHVVRTVYL